jgi:hypothetical protein
MGIRSFRKRVAALAIMPSFSDSDRLGAEGGQSRRACAPQIDLQTDLQFQGRSASIELTETGVLRRCGAEKIPSNPIRIIPAWEAFEAERLNFLPFQRKLPCFMQSEA